MGAVIKVNGTEINNCLVIVDTLCKDAKLQPEDACCVKLDMDKCRIEVNIYGDIDID